MARPAQCSRPYWRTVTLLAITLYPVTSFCPLSTVAGRQTLRPRTKKSWTLLAPSTSTINSSSMARSSRAGATSVAAGQQDFLSEISARTTARLKSNDTLEEERLSSSSAFPPNDETPDAAAGVDSSNVSSVSGSTTDKRGNAKTTRESVSRKPPLVARSLDSVRGSLIRQEETIIFALIEREQFRCNTAIYTDRTFRLNRSDAADIYGRDASFLEYMLCETEKLHARVRRYMSLEELAFFPMFLPEPILPPLDFPRLLAPNDVNVNDQILHRYVSEIVPMICEPGDDEQHGSSVVCDVSALQALSRRVHLGKFVAESKFQEDSKTYQELCRAGDVLGVLELLTNRDVEKRVLQRAFMKASTYGSDIDVPVVPGGGERSGGGGIAKGEHNFKVEPQTIVDIYRDTVIPLTKDVEILYLFQRTGYPCPSLEGIHDKL